jgi:tRNA/tmRNA/rRNA uracil-C5-methylase (TrmA/RlmC/RlmD family)
MESKRYFALCMREFYENNKTTCDSYLKSVLPTVKNKNKKRLLKMFQKYLILKNYLKF